MDENQIKKFDSNRHLKFAKNLPFSYLSTLLYLDFCAYRFQRNGEAIIVWQDVLYPHDFPSIFLPRKKENWIRASMAMITDEEIKKVEKEKIKIFLKKEIDEEYYYSTENILKKTGKIGQRVRQFEKLYRYKVLNDYPINEIESFYKRWLKQRNRSKSLLFKREGEELFYFCLRNLKKYQVKQVYVEINGKLVGFAWGVKHKKNWIGLHLKVDYKYKGLSYFLQQKRAELFKNYELFSLGTACGEPGLANYKIELGPVLIKKYSYLLTGEKFAK